MPKLTSAMVGILRVTQSPMNPKVWCVDLQCGHDVWVTGRKPRKTAKIHCEKCTAFWKTVEETRELKGDY